MVGLSCFKYHPIVQQLGLAVSRLTCLLLQGPSICIMAEDLTAFPKFALDKIHSVGVNNEPETILNYNIVLYPNGKSIHQTNLMFNTTLL